jgi:hypothetical protein
VKSSYFSVSFVDFVVHKYDKTQKNVLLMHLRPSLLSKASKFRLTVPRPSLLGKASDLVNSHDRV